MSIFYTIWRLFIKSWVINPEQENCIVERTAFIKMLGLTKDTVDADNLAKELGY